MNLGHRASTILLASVLLPAVPGCAVPVSAGEATGQSEESVSTKKVTVGASAFAAQMASVGLSKATLAAAGNKIVFTPPPLLVSLGLAKTIVANMPEVHPIELGNVLPATALSLTSFSLAPEGQELVARAVIAGTYGFAPTTEGPDAKTLQIHIDSAAVTLHFAEDATGHLALVTTTLDSFKESLAVCPPLQNCYVDVSWARPSVHAMIVEGATMLATQALASLDASWLYDLRANANEPASPPTSSTWSVVKTSIAIAASTISFLATDGLSAPPIPPPAQ